MEEVWQNQRHYGLAGWLSPTPFERGQWTDCSGKVVDVKSNIQEDYSWTPVVTEQTDSEGWTYSTGFARIERPRDGGRACKRATDRVRRRKWIKTDVTLFPN